MRKLLKVSATSAVPGAIAKRIISELQKNINEYIDKQFKKYFALN
jgi:hypothetical protein